MQRASVLECVRPSGAVAQDESCQPVGKWIFPSRGYWRAAHGSRKNTARANEPWLLGLPSGGRVPKRWRATALHDASAFATHLPIANRPGPRPSSGAET